MEQYNSTSWDKISDTTLPYKVTQYEKDANEDAQSASLDSEGNVIYEPVLIKDSVSGGNVEAFWSEMLLDNAFLLLSDEDCAICLDSLLAPVITHCAHVFCKPCICQVIQNEQVSFMPSIMKTQAQQRL